MLDGLSERSQENFQNYSFPFIELKCCLDEITESICESCNVNVLCDALCYTDDGKTDCYYDHPAGSLGYDFCQMKVFVGIKSLLNNMRDDNFVRDYDFVKTVFQCFHENAHVWQRSVGFMQRPGKSTDVMKDMARMRAVVGYFGKYNRTAYTFDSAEIMANWYACLKTKEYVEDKARDDSRFAGLDIDTPICNSCKKAYGHDWPAVLHCDTVDDMANVFGDMFDYALFRKTLDYDAIWKLKASSTTSEHMFEFLNDMSNVRQLLDAEDGVKQLDIMCKYVAKKSPALFRGLICIKDEYLHGSANTVVERLAGHMLFVHPRKWAPLDVDAVNDAVVVTRKSARDVSDLGRLLDDGPVGSDRHEDGPDF